MRKNKNPTTQKSMQKLGPTGFIITCALALCVLAAAGWGTASLMQPAVVSVKARGMSNMKSMNMKGMNSAKNNSNFNGWYQDPKHPWIIEPQPGPSPVDGKPMVPLNIKKFSNNILVNPATVQNIGIQTAKARRGPAIQHVLAVGEVEYDQTKLYDLNVKVNGWVTSLNVASVGQKVRKGELLFTLNSPQLYSAKQQYLIAIRSIKNSPAPSSRLGNPPASATKNNINSANINTALARAARAKLKFLGLSDKQIKTLSQRKTAARLTHFYSPYQGVVVKKNIIQGAHIKPGMRVYKIADLSKVWVIASVYGAQSAHVQAGQSAKMKLAALAGQVFVGQVEYVYPYFDATTHQQKLRMVFDNPKGILKPGMLAQVILTNKQDKPAILIPRRAVVDTGNKKLVFVATGNGHFQPRNITTGAVTYNGFIVIKKGIKAGENVVTSGEFLLASEANVHAAKARMTAGQGGKTSGAMGAMPGMPGMNMGGMKMGGK